MKTVAIIQARLNSVRLPRKVLLPLAGKSMLENIWERVRRAKLIDEAVVAIPKADKYEVSKVWFCSSDVDDENDLIGRYYDTAKVWKADLVVRVCADNPFIQPEAIDMLINTGTPISEQTILSNAGDYRTTENDFGWPNGIGAELYSMELLKWMDKELKKPTHREHPHLWFHENHHVIVPTCPEAWRRPGLRFDVNTLAQYESIKEIFDHFGRNDFTITEVFQFLESQNMDERAVS
jgi:spore coat polysaccharide biosynthesis protein SpsF